MDIKENLKIEIRPIPNRNGIRKFSEDLEYFSQNHIIAPLVDPSTYKYVTGLSEGDIKWLKEERKVPYNLDDNWIQGVPHEFWESNKVKTELRNRPMFLYPGKNPMDFIKYKYLLKHKYIYKSEAEMKNGGKPEATHYIYNEEEHISNKAVKLTKKNKLINEVSKLSPARKRNIILIILNEQTDNKDEDYLTVRLNDIIENEENSYLLTQLLEEHEDVVVTKADVRKAIQSNVLRRTTQGIFFFETNLGYSEEDVVKELLKEESQELYLNIKSKIN